MSGITQIDIEGLPKPEIIEELAVELIVTQMRDDLVARFPAIANVIDLESEPARKLIEVFAYREVNLRARVNDAARANLVAFANRSDLDHLAGFYDVLRMPGEDDERLRTRIILAVAGRSTGGTEPRYRLIAMSASLRVRDAIVWREGVSPVVNVAVYSTDPGGVADAPLLALVTAALNDRAKRMANDTIVVRSAVTQTVNVTAKVWLLPETPNSVFDALPINLRADWERESGLGFDVTKAWIGARLMRPGVQKVEIVAPAADIVLPPYQAAALGVINLVNEGRAH